MEDTSTGPVVDGWQAGTHAPMATWWDGSRWHRTVAPLPSGGNYGTLASVSCKPGGCLAVGFYYAPPDHDPFALAEFWDDSTRAPVTLAFPPGPRYQSLSAVSCVTARWCIATGYYHDAGGTDRPVAATWDGHQWSWSQPPAPAGTWNTVDLPSISCVTARYCVAVGHAVNYSRSGGSIGFTETWNGHDWTYAPAPLATSVSCSAAGHCVAVGMSYGDGGVPAGSGQLLDGARWAEPAMPWPRGTLSSSLYGVSCAAKTCLAVGEAERLQDPDIITGSRPAALTWNGATWTRPAIAGSISGTLFGVTCVTATDCVAVGSAQSGKSTHSLAGFWNGATWTIANLT